MLSALQDLIKYCFTTKGGDDTKQFPVQQISFMGNVVDAFIVFPWGMHANVSKDALGIALGINADDQSIAAIMTSANERIKDLKEGEVIFFHPKSKTFTHYKNGGDLDVSVNGSENVNITKDWNITVGGNVNLKAANVKIDASTTELGLTGKFIARLADEITVDVAIGDIEVDTGTGKNTSAFTLDGTITTASVNNKSI